MYDTCRQANERFHSQLKAESSGGISERGWVRVRGIAKFSLLAAMATAATNRNVIRKHHAEGAGNKPSPAEERRRRRERIYASKANNAAYIAMRKSRQLIVSWRLFPFPKPIGVKTALQDRGRKSVPAENCKIQAIPDPLRPLKPTQARSGRKPRSKKPIGVLTKNPPRLTVYWPPRERHS